MINIAGNGFGLGSFNSSVEDFSAATVQPGETFAPAILVAGQSQKSIWFKFTLPTTRSVRVTLAQQGTAINAGDVGFAVYKSDTCLPALAAISTKLTPIGLFGNTLHPCVEPGEYLVQVSGKSIANGLLYVQVTTAPTVAAYDNQLQAYDFGTLSTGVKTTAYSVDCQSMEDAGEICTTLGDYKRYNKTTWHVFKTPAYFDYIVFFFAHQSALANQKFGYNLYKGDVRVASYSSLPVTDGCDSLQTNTFYAARKVYKCDDLEPNTTYSIQLLFHEDFSDNVSVTMVTNGIAKTQAPEPLLSAIPAPSNSMGVLPAGITGITTNKFDYLACNSQHSIHPCSPSLPANGVLHNGVRYNLSSFFTFTLSGLSDVSLYAVPAACGPNLLVRLYKQPVTNNCSSLDTANIISEYLYNNTSLSCLDPGDYTIQVLGSDMLINTNYTYSSFSNTTNPPCILSNLGQRFNLGINVRKINDQRYSLSLPGAFDSLNTVAGIMQPLVNGTLYTTRSDTFGCANTVLPSDTACLPSNRKALYREFVIADSGIISMTNANANWFKLYQGDANALAIAQNAHLYPQRINGLTPYTQCLRFTDCGGTKVCLVPGTYTYATFGGDANVSQASQPAFRLNVVNTIHNNALNAENMGDILNVIPATGGSVQSSLDYFSCHDNAVIINGYQPCAISGQAATKAIYRQFYLSAASNISISGAHTDPACGNQYGGYMTLFAGKATDGLAVLTPLQSPWRCFLNASVSSTTCSNNPLPAGWYTVVSYGTGPSYSNAFQNINQNNSYGSYIGISDQIRITMTVTTSCAAPRYNRPYKAAIDTGTGKPFLIQWGARAAHTSAYPKTDTTYTLYTENFNCTTDTPFSAHPLPNCNTALTKVAYYIFRLTQESYVQIDTKNYWAAVYAGDARRDSALFSAATLIQPCLQANGQIQLCRLQPGDYTLVVFAGSAQSCNTVTPTIYVDQVGYSRFDHAINAYDFGVVPADSIFYNGKPGDVNPLNAGRSPSNDFFYCTTGAQATDPTQAACMVNYLPSVYNTSLNNALYTPSTLTSTAYKPRRNLWYTFVISQQGTVRIKVNNKTPGKLVQYPFAVFKSNADGSLPFNTLVNSGQVDSTIAQGLTLITDNITGIFCTSVNEIVFNTTASCQPERYYILVENRGGDPNTMNPNSQAEVQVLFSSLCPGPKYNRPHKAAIDTNTGKPFLLTWGPRAGHTAAYPKTDTTYTLYKENFNCTVDTPFAAHSLTGCNAALVKVAYYVVHINQISYLQIDTKGFWSALYAGDARTDSASFKTSPPVQTCLQSNGLIQICRLEPGDYTLVIFATAAQTCTSVTPAIYIDRAEYSRFDHAVNAYDFGPVPPDNIFYNGKPKEVNPIDAGRAASSDFFYCTTGSQKTDPAGAVCNEAYLASIYNSDKNNALYNASTIPAAGTIPRRNIWYTFVISQGGNVKVRVTSKTPGKLLQYPFAVYKTDADATLPFGTLVSTGEVDSTLTQGLTLVSNNNISGNCNGANEIAFSRSRCITTPERYYVIVEDRYDNAGTMKTASQLDVAVSFDSLNAIQPLFDHYSRASLIGNALGSGTYTGATDNFSCATRDIPDPVYASPNCNKTLWYKFSTTVSGQVRFRIKVNNSSYYTYNYIQLFRQVIPGDSTIRGLQILNAANSGVFDASVGATWGQTCISPGTYYLMLPGCGMGDEYVSPIIQITEKTGDFCTAPVVATLNGAGSVNATVLVDCNTIGSDYGEFNPTLTCPLGAMTAAYKTSWFKISITGKDTLDVTTSLNENTNALSSEIKYRLMNGNCDAMQERSCVQDALTQDTYKCLAPGDYFVQVFTPVIKSGTPVTGTIDLKLSAVPHADTCALFNSCLANANFVPRFNCNTDAAVRFINYSTFGVAIVYEWDFGYGGQTSNEVSPSFKYPELDIDKTYSIKLKILNASCGGRDSITLPFTVVARPKLNLGPDTTLCKAISLTLNASTWQGASYVWNTGATTASISASGAGTQTFSVKVTYKGCSSADTIAVSKNPITTKKGSSFICPGDSVLLSSKRSAGETYLWNTGSTDYFIYANTAGLYTDTLSWQTCKIVDTFQVSAPAYPLGTDTAVCFAQAFVLNAASPNAKSYQWQNGSTSSTYTVSAPGQYWVQISYGACTIRDSVHVNSLQAKVKNADAFTCSNQPYTLPSGAVVQVPGMYTDTLKSRQGCDSIINNINLRIQAAAGITTKNAILCPGKIYALPWGAIADKTGTYIDTVKSSTGCDSIITIVNLKVQDVAAVNKAVSVCPGQSYQLPSGKIVYDPGIYRDTMKYISGCDSSIATVTVTFYQTISKTTDVSICADKVYMLPSGLVVSKTGIYNDTVRYSAGCDSLVTVLMLTVKPVSLVNMSASVCSGQPYNLPWDSLVYKNGTYKKTFYYGSGCDSAVITVQLNVTIARILPSAAEICAGDAFTTPAGIKLSRSGTYSDTLRGRAGCDSIIHVLRLTVNPLPVVTITKSNDINCLNATSRLTATGGSRYNWYPATSLNNASISNPVAAPESNTLYTVQVTNNKNCTIRDSIHVLVTNANADDKNIFQMPNSFTPNDDGNNDCFGVRHWGLVKDLDFSVYTRWGQIIFHTSNSSECWDGTYNGRKMDVGGYVYLIKATTISCGKISRNGIVLLIR